MRIVHIIPAFTQGGAEEMLLKIIEASRSCGDAHIVIGLKSEGAMRKRFSRLCTTFSLGIRGPLPGPWTATRLPILVRSLTPDLIQGWMYHGNLAATWSWLMQTKRPLLGWSIRQTLYGLSQEKLFSRPVIRLNARLARLPDVVIYNSRCALEQHRDFGLASDNAVIVPNGFDVAKFSPNLSAGRAFRAEIGIPDSAPVIGMLARLHPMKNHSGFICSAARVLEKMPDAHFVMAGSNVDRAHLFSLTESQIKRPERIHLLGERRDTPAFMNALDVLAVPSSWGEAFPNVLGEAMACGTLCVATEIGDSRLIMGNTGLIVPPRNPQAMADAIVAVLEMSPDRRQKLSEEARGSIRDRFSIKEVARQYRKIYADLLESGV